MYSLPEEQFQGGKRVLRRAKTQGVVTGGPALIDAVNRSKVHLAKFILDAVDKSSNILEYQDFKGKTPLIRTCYIKDAPTRISMLTLLLEYGANANAVCDQGRTLLSYCCELQCNDAIKMLMKCSNINPDTADQSGNTPLMYCAMVGNHVGLSLILRPFRRLGLNVDAVNARGQTASLLALQHGNLCCLRALLTDGRASSNIIDANNGRSLVELVSASIKVAPEKFDVSKLPEHSELEEPGTPPLPESATEKDGEQLDLNCLADQLAEAQLDGPFPQRTVGTNDAQCQSEADALLKDARKVSLLQAQQGKNATFYYRSSALDYFSAAQSEPPCPSYEHSLASQSALQTQQKAKVHNQNQIQHQNQPATASSLTVSASGVSTHKKKLSDGGSLSKDVVHRINESDEQAHNDNDNDNESSN